MGIYITKVMLAFDDATKDPEEWNIVSFAKYYNKKTIVVGD
nr:hypothetical protein [uncultured Butyrivibrio sp.]